MVLSDDVLSQVRNGRSGIKGPDELLVRELSVFDPDTCIPDRILWLPAIGGNTNALRHDVIEHGEGCRVATQRIEKHRAAARIETGVNDLISIVPCKIK